MVIFICFSGFGEKGLVWKKGSKKEKFFFVFKFFYGVGYIYNDFIVNVWFSYLIIFLIKVVGLFNVYVGLVILIG